MSQRVVVVADLGFGDSGKGRLTDLLAEKMGATRVCRFNGGAQAGHNVITADGRHHTFSQLGAASFLPQVSTTLLEPVLFHPTALRAELARAATVGLSDVVHRLSVHAGCRVNTPFHQAANRLREGRRSARHGSCGVGVGETVAHSLEHPEEVLTAGLLGRRGPSRERLFAIQARFAPLAGGEVPAWLADDAALLRDPGAPDRFLAEVDPLLPALRVLPAEQIAAELRASPAMVMEGAQGLLLDEWFGTHPHTTWSTTTPNAALRLLEEAGVRGEIKVLGLLRSYLTRHGAGPLPTEDPALDEQTPEPHNEHGPWQGAFRRGWPDAVLLRYALDVCSRLGAPVQGLALTHVDTWERLARKQRAIGYLGLEGPLPLGTQGDLDHQSALTASLFAARPVYAPVEGPLDALLAAETGLPVWALPPPPAQRRSSAKAGSSPSA